MLSTNIGFVVKYRVVINLELMDQLRNVITSNGIWSNIIPWAMQKLYALSLKVHANIFFLCFWIQAVCPIGDDDDGHLSYKLGDIIENDTHKCELDIRSKSASQKVS